MSSRVLLLENDPDIVVISSMTLVDAGYDVDVARTVDDALRACEEHPPDLALIDIKLGSSSSGWDFLRAIRSEGNCPEMRVAVYSVHADETDQVETALQFGVDAIFGKSGDPMDLVTRVRLLLG